MIRFVYDRPSIHDEFSAVKKVDFYVDDEASLDEMYDAYDHFLRAIGYYVQTDDVQEPMGQQDTPSSVLPDMGKVRDILP